MAFKLTKLENPTQIDDGGGHGHLMWAWETTYFDTRKKPPEPPYLTPFSRALYDCVGPKIDRYKERLVSWLQSHNFISQLIPTSDIQVWWEDNFGFVVGLKDENGNFIPDIGLADTDEGW